MKTIIKKGQIWEISGGDIVYTLKSMPQEEPMHHYAGQYYGQYYERWYVLILDQKSHWLERFSTVTIYPDRYKFTCRLLC